MNPAAPEKVAGHPCQPAEATVAASDGSATVLRLWRATDLKGLPVRITCAANGTPLTLTLSKVRLEALPDDLFLPPNGFTKYDSAKALMNELAARQQNYKRRPTYQTEEVEPGSGMEGRPARHNPSRLTVAARENLEQHQNVVQPRSLFTVLSCISRSHLAVQSIRSWSEAASPHFRHLHPTFSSPHCAQQLLPAVTG